MKREIRRGTRITYLAVTESAITLLSIYDKSEKENIDDKELLKLLKYVK